MEKVELSYKSGTIPYFCTDYGPDADIENTIGYRAKHLERHQRGIFGYVLEAFAAHCKNLIEDLHISVEYTVAICEELRLVANGDEVFFCMPDSCSEDLGDFTRGSSEEITSLNWYAYSAAREVVLEWVEFSAEHRYKDHLREQARSAIADYEWRNIKKIHNYKHLFDYPRPSDDRLGYLSNCGVDEVPLVLS